MKRWLIALGVLVLAGAAEAACPPIPFVFAQGSPFNATQVNTNFTSLRDCFNTTPGVFGPPITVIDHVATWGNTTGSLLKDASALSLTGLTVSGAPSSWTMTPTNQIDSSITYHTTASGTVTTTPTDTNQMAQIWFRQEGALLGPGVNRSMGMLEVDYNDTGTVTQDDSYTAITGNCNLLGTRVNTGIQRLGTACVGVVAAARGVAHQGGAPGTEAGEIHALNIIGGISSVPPFTPPSNYYDVIGAEVNMTGYTGGTMLIRYGFNSIDFGNGGSGDSEQGSRSDAAYNIASVGGTKGWKTGINFGGAPTYAGNAIAGTGTLLGSDAVGGTGAQHGIDLNNFVITGFAFRGPNGLFAVSGSGNVAGQTITAQENFVANNPNADSAVIQFQDTGTPTWNVGRLATTNDFVIQNVATVTTNFNITPAGVVSLGSVNPVSVSATGSLLVPGVSTAIGSITGSLCFDSGTSVVIYKVGANCL